MGHMEETHSGTVCLSEINLCDLSFCNCGQEPMLKNASNLPNYYQIKQLNANM